MARSRGAEGGDVGPPTRYAEGPPSPTEGGGGLPLMAVMEIQRTLGSLTQAVETLRESQKETNIKLTEVCQKVHTAQTIAGVVGAGLVATLGIVGWIINHAIELLPSLLAAKK